MKLMSAVNRQIDNQLGNIKNILNEELFIRMEVFSNDLAEYATPISAIIGAVIGLVVAIKTDSLSIFLGGFVWILMLILCHYTGSKLQKSCQSTIENNPSSVASQDYLDVISVINLIAALVSLIWSAYIAIKMSSLTPFLIGICVSLVLIYTIWITLNPRLVSTYVEASSSAGVDAIAILVLTNKIYLRSNKVFFGLFPTIGAGLLVKALYESFGDPTALLYGGIYGAIGFVLVLIGLISPFLCYLAFIFSYMVLDVLRSILSLGKGGGESAPRSSALPSIEPITVPVVVNEISVKSVQRVLMGAVILAAVVGSGIKGKEYYLEYQLQAEAKRVADEIKKAEYDRKKAEDEKIEEERVAEKERLAEEKVRINEFVAKARRHVNASSLDFIIDPEINQAFQKILKTDADMRAFEGYFRNPENVSESEGIIIGQGCKDPCEVLKTFVFVDIKTGAVAAAINTGDRILYFGVSEPNAPPLMKKWAIALR